MVRMDSAVIRDRIASGVAAAALQALLLYGLIAGLGFYRGAPAEPVMRLLPLSPEPPPPPREPPAPEPPSEAPKEAAAPPALRAEAAPIVAPPPLVRIELPPPLPAAPIAGTGSRPAQGASDISGPGTGSGGEGSGTGGGGSGDGGSGQSGPPVRTRRIRGHFTNEDYPRAAEGAGIQGTVVARLIVGTKGRVTACRIRLSSGSEALDEATCRIILKRFRFAPALDASGAATTDIVEWEQAWSLRPEDRPEYAEAECRVRAGRAGDAAGRRAEFLSCMSSFGWAR